MGFKKIWGPSKWKNELMIADLSYSDIYSGSKFLAAKAE